MAYENIISEIRGRVGLVTLNRPRSPQCPQFGTDR